MPERIRCPNCQAAVRSEAGAIPSRCPTCGARLAPGSKRKPEGAPTERPPAAAPAHAGPADEHPPLRRKRRRRPPKAAGIDLVGPLQALGAAALLLAVSYGLSWVVWLVANSQALARTPAAAPGPGPAGGQAGPEPHDAPTVLAPVGRSFQVNGDPLLSSGDARYVMDTPLEEGSPVPALAQKDGPMIRMTELSSGRLWGWMAKAALRGKEALLSPDGRALVTLGVAAGPGKPPPLEVWRTNGTEPAAQLPVEGSAFWMEFLSPAELAVAVHDAAGARVQVFNIASGTPARTLPLPKQAFPPPEAQGPLPHAPDRLVGDFAPQDQLLALGGQSAVVVLSAQDGRAVATLRVAGGGERVEYRGMRFAPSGGQLSAVAAVRQGNGPTAVHLKTWQVPDGRTTQDVTLADPNAFGPPLPGPGPDRVLVLAPRSVGTRRPLLGLVVDARTGATVAEVPYRPLRGLDDGRLLVVGPVKDAPPPLTLSGYPAAPPPVSAEAAQNRPGGEPDVRAVYALALTRGDGR